MATLEPTSNFRIFPILLLLFSIPLSIGCAAFVCDDRSDIELLIFTPGFVITAGYIARCFCTLPLFWLKMIWGSSAVVQGSWLLSYFGAMAYQSAKYKEVPTTGDCINFLTIWWIFSLAVSIYGFFFDKNGTRLTNHWSER